MADPLTIAVVAATGKSAEAMIAGGTAATRKVIELVKRRFSSEPDAALALVAAETGAEEHRERLELALDRVRAADPEFDRELTALVGPLRSGSTATFNNHGDVADGATFVQAQHIENLTIRPK